MPKSNSNRNRVPPQSQSPAAPQSVGPAADPGSVASRSGPDLFFIGSQSHDPPHPPPSHVPGDIPDSWATPQAVQIRARLAAQANQDSAQSAAMWSNYSGTTTQSVPKRMQQPPITPGNPPKSGPQIPESFSFPWQSAHAPSWTGIHNSDSGNAYCGAAVVPPPYVQAQPGVTRSQAEIEFMNRPLEPPSYPMPDNYYEYLAREGEQFRNTFSRSSPLRAHETFGPCHEAYTPAQYQHMPCHQACIPDPQRFSSAVPSDPFRPSNPGPFDMSSNSGPEPRVAAVGRGVNLDRSHSNEFWPPGSDAMPNNPYVTGLPFSQDPFGHSSELIAPLLNPRPAYPASPEPYSYASPGIPSEGWYGPGHFAQNQISFRDFTPNANPGNASGLDGAARFFGQQHPNAFQNDAFAQAPSAAHPFNYGHVPVQQNLFSAGAGQSSMFGNNAWGDGGDEEIPVPTAEYVTPQSTGPNVVPIRPNFNRPSAPYSFSANYPNSGQEPAGHSNGYRPQTSGYPG